MKKQQGRLLARRGLFSSAQCTSSSSSRLVAATRDARSTLAGANSIWVSHYGTSSANGHNWRDRETYSSTLKPVEDSHSLVPAAYFDPAFFELEKEKIFGKTWVCAGYTTELPQVGDTKCLEVAGQSILITRDKQGGLKGFYNVCRHRGSKVVIDEGISNHKVLTCPYHCWSYTLEGKLLGVSMFNKARRENKIERGDPTLSLLPIQVDTWGPFIFVNLDAANTIPLSTQLGDLKGRYPRYFVSDDQKKQVGWQHVRHKGYRANTNWKNAMENFNDWYHVPWVHKTLAPTSEVSNHVIMQGPGMYTGFGTVPLSKGGSPADADYLPALSTLNEMETKSAVFLHLFPNISLFFLPHHILSLALYPVNAELTLESLDLFIPDEVLDKVKDKTEREAKIDKLFDFWDKVNVEDVVACENVQKGQKVKGYTGGPFSQFEVMIHRLQSMVVESLVEDKSGKERDFHTRYAPFYDEAACKECHHYNDMRH